MHFLRKITYGEFTEFVPEKKTTHNVGVLCTIYVIVTGEKKPQNFSSISVENSYAVTMFSIWQQ